MIRRRFFSQAIFHAWIRSTEITTIPCFRQRQRHRGHKTNNAECGRFLYLALPWYVGLSITRITFLFTVAHESLIADEEPKNQHVAAAGE